MKMVSRIDPTIDFDTFKIILGRYEKFVEILDKPGSEPMTVFNPLKPKALEELQMIRELSVELQIKKDEDIRKAKQKAEEDQKASEEEEKHIEDEKKDPEVVEEEKKE